MIAHLKGKKEKDKKTQKTGWLFGDWTKHKKTQKQSGFYWFLKWDY